jgi:hypothetical protein
MHGKIAYPVPLQLGGCRYSPRKFGQNGPLSYAFRPEGGAFEDFRMFITPPSLKLPAPATPTAC